MKLYEVLMRKIGVWQEAPKQPEKSQEERIYNPIKCKVGGVVKIDSLDFRDHRFTVREIKEYSLSLGGSYHRMVDYVLLARPIGKPDLKVILRLVPDKDSNSKVSHRALLLTLYDELEYNEGLHNVVKDDTGKFEIDDNSDPENVVHDEFWRVNDVLTSYLANVKTLTDDDGDGKVDTSEVKNSKVEYWDYYRDTDVEGVEIQEFVFVQMDSKNGWFQIWRGSEVNSERIDVF